MAWTSGAFNSRQAALEKRADVQETIESYADYEKTLAWDGKPDEASFRISAKGLATRESIIDVCIRFLHNLDFKFDEHYGLRGGPQPVGHNWTVTFTGKYLTAAARVRKALTSLRRPNGTWQQFVAFDPEGNELEVFISADKNEKQRATEVLGKKLKTAFE